nr:MAG TPA: hypothetical protein [Caudoviricetes sp.]
MPLKGTRKKTTKTTKKPTKNQIKVVKPKAPTKRKRKPPKPKTPLDAIHKKCRECCCGTLAEVQACEIDDCALWHYRMTED